MVGDVMNLVEVSIEKDSNGNPTCIVWPDGRRSCARPARQADSHTCATSTSSEGATGHTAGRS